MRREGGFTLVELMVASGVMATALAMLAGVLTSGLSATAYARERQSANSLANQVLEQIRGLPFNRMKSGLLTSDLAGDPNILQTGCPTAPCIGGESIVNSGGVSAVTPLVPHRQTITVGKTAFTVSAYITYYNNDATSDARRATAVVTWSSVLANTQKSVSVQTILFDTQTGPSSCQSLDVHPVLGPCSPTFGANAGSTTAEAGSISISGTIGSLGIDHATLWTGAAASDATIQQISKVDGTIKQSGATIQATGGTESTAGLALLSSHSDTDPDTSSAVYDSQSLTPVAGTSTISASGNSLAVNASAGDGGSTISTTSACTSNCSAPASPSPRNCPATGAFYTQQNDGLHCGASTETTGGSTTAVASLSGIGNVTLASLTGQTVNTVVDRQTSTGGTACTATSGDGCVRAQIGRSGVALSAGSLPPGFNIVGLLSIPPVIQLSSYADSVMSEAGISANPPTASQTAGSITVLCGGGLLGNLFCPLGTLLGSTVTKTFSQITSLVTLPTLTVPGPGGTTLSITVTITPGTTSCSTNSAPAVSPCPNTGATSTVTAATATSSPPKVSIAYAITGSSSPTNLTIAIDPGTLTSTTSYAPPPTS